jgi:hypothetical protein
MDILDCLINSWLLNFSISGISSFAACLQRLSFYCTTVGTFHGRSIQGFDCEDVVYQSEEHCISKFN